MGLGWIGTPGQEKKRALVVSSGQIIYVPPGKKHKDNYAASHGPSLVGNGSNANAPTGNNGNNSHHSPFSSCRI